MRKKTLLNMILLIISACFLVGIETFGSIYLAIPCLMGLLLLVISIRSRFLMSFRWLGLFLILLSLISTRSILLFLLAFLILFFILRDEEKVNFFSTEERWIQAVDLKAKDSLDGKYLQAQQLLLVDKTDKKQSLISFDDVNLVYLGGNHVINLEHAVLEDKEIIVSMMKLFGRTRIVIPADLPIDLSISCLKANVQIEDRKEYLYGELYRYQDKRYLEQRPRLRIVMTVALGEVEVIRL